MYRENNEFRPITPSLGEIVRRNQAANVNRSRRLLNTFGVNFWLACALLGFGLGNFLVWLHENFGVFPGFK